MLKMHLTRLTLNVNDLRQFSAGGMATGYEENEELAPSIIVFFM